MNGGGDKDADVTEGKAVFYEHDDLPKEDQLFLWQSLSLPEPTFQVDTGGKSIHSYWVFDEPIDVEIWRTLQTDLLNYSKGDKTIKNPSRVMRLAGFKHQKTGELASIVSKSGTRYSYDELRSLIPPTPVVVKETKQKQKQDRKPPTPKSATSSNIAIPLENCLAKSNRELLGGVSEGGRNDAGATLARDLIGTADYLNSTGQQYMGDARNLFDRFCSGCSPSLDDIEADSIWDSAQSDNPSPSCQTEGVNNILAAWNGKNSPATEEDKRRCPYFESSPAGGLWMVSLVKDDTADGYDDESAPMKRKRERIGNHLEIISYVTNTDGCGSALWLEFQTVRGYLARRLFLRKAIVHETAAAVSQLVDAGYHLKLKQKSNFVQYLNTLGAEDVETITLADSTGWHQGNYLTPHKSYGTDNLRFRNVEPSPDVPTEIKGDLAGWQTEIGSKCKGNSRLLFAVASAFAATLLEFADMGSGGFHFVGQTSEGKTVLLLVACSVNGVKKFSTWRTTANGLESIATGSNGALLCQDELGQAEKAVGDAIYMLGNGQGKTRMNKDLGTRTAKQWNLLFLSTGEISLDDYMAQSGVAIKGGQEVRMPSIPAVPMVEPVKGAMRIPSPLGVFENIHNADSSKDFAKDLESACEKYRGSAIDAWLTRLVVDRGNPDFASNLKSRIREAANKLTADISSHAIGRIADRFALVQVAMEMALDYGILPDITPPDCSWAVKTVFDDWIDSRGGDGSIEVKKACDRIRHLIVSNLHSDRVYDLKDRNVNQKVRNLLGYVKSDEGDAATEVWVPIPVFNSEVCQGVNKALLIAELQKRGWLAAPLGDDRPTHQRRFKGKLSRFFVFLNPSFSSSEKDMGTVGTMGTVVEKESSNGFEGADTVPKQEKANGDSGDSIEEYDLQEPASVNDLDPDILTDF